MFATTKATLLRWKRSASVVGLHADGEEFRYFACRNEHKVWRLEVYALRDLAGYRFTRPDDRPVDVDHGHRRLRDVKALAGHYESAAPDGDGHLLRRMTRALGAWADEGRVL